MPALSFGERITSILIEDGLLPPDQLEEVLALQKEKGGQILKLLTEKRYVTEHDMMISMGRCLDTPPVNLAKLRIPESIMDLVPRDLARTYKICPVSKIDDKLFVAMVDPLNVIALDDLRQRTEMDIRPMIATEKAVGEALSGIRSSSADMDQVMKDAAFAAATLEVEQGRRTDEIDLDQLALESEDAPVVKIVNLILVQAMKQKASDIHIEPFEKELRLRYRLDGSLVAEAAPPKALQMPITSRIKILAGLDIAERRLPQDGRFRIRASGKEVDLRVSILPTIYGEKIVMRLLDKGTLAGSVDQIGLDEYTYKQFKKAIDSPHGMILLTGPTGSGKTTTLYSVLQELNDPQYNIVTVEDPVEYQLTGINQVAAKSEIGLGFAEALRSILRQDPDIVMIGEIRDNETADIAVKAALTGHQVLSTLHTNDAAGAITRLDDMGIEPFLISSSVILACAQRLVRRICSNCREEYTPDPSLLAKFEDETIGDSVFYHGAGCARCNQRGYSGRAAILEVLPISESIKRLIMKRASASVIKNQAVSEGMKTLRMVGLDKAREGITTLEEVLGVTSEDT